MNKDSKSNAALYWVLGVSLVSMGVFVYLVLADSPKSLPKINLSYFVDETEVVTSVSKRLFLEINNNSNFWIGLEPNKQEEVGLAVKLKQELEKKSAFKKIIVDQELNLKSEDLKALGATDVFYLKDNLSPLGDKIIEWQKQNLNYLVITASIYSTSLLKGNPLSTLKEKFQISPMTFSMGYFSTDLDDEKQLVFNCNTEDNSGTRDWGCFVVNKARSARRKIDFNNQKAWVGLMDLTGENDYAILMKKK